VLAFAGVSVGRLAVEKHSIEFTLVLVLPLIPAHVIRLVEIEDVQILDIVQEDGVVVAKRALLLQVLETRFPIVFCFFDATLVASHVDASGND
jgi:hypothetical protein